VQLCWQPTTEGLLDQVGARLLEQVRAQGSKRVLIDSLGAFSRLASTRRAQCVLPRPDR
jgi:circadian clock protein KaiC